VENSSVAGHIAAMRRDEVIARLKQTEPAMKEFGVAALYLFGSHARDKAPGFGCRYLSSIPRRTRILAFCRSRMPIKF
jgi:hypothetical protein